MATKKCKVCGKSLRCPHCDGAAGGRKSRRKLSPQDQAAMRAARKTKAQQGGTR